MDFDELVNRYEKPVYNLIYRLIGDRDDAADVTQDTFLAAFKSFDAFRAESSEYTWLYRIAINQCRNRLRRMSRERDYECDFIDEEQDGPARPAFGDAPVSSERPELALQHKELKERIEQAISRLPPDYRIVVVLRDMHGLSYQEIASAADLTVEVVRTRLARARGMLRKKLEPYLIVSDE